MERVLEGFEKSGEGACAADVKDQAQASSAWQIAIFHRDGNVTFPPRYGGDPVEAPTAITYRSEKVHDYMPRRAGEYDVSPADNKPARDRAWQDEMRRG